VRSIRFFLILGTILFIAVALSSPLLGYERYNDGCDLCHGSFTDGTSQKGSVFPQNNKHVMHRSNSYMGADCNLCHTSGDGNDPFIGSSDGTNDNPGLGCTGCHAAFGLRAHHAVSSITCSGCHPNDPAPLPENTVPVYYGTADVDAAIVDPCNLSGLTNTDENWTIGDLVGLDNDGDGLYDVDDPDCATATATPGEMPNLLVPSHDKAAQSFAVSYDTTTCETTSNNVFYGPLSQVSGYGYSGQGCTIGNTGTYTFDYSAIAESIFFVIVAQNGVNEGSYGLGELDAERPESNLCPESQLLVDRCD
jgi:hypothetical protein